MSTRYANILYAIMILDIGATEQIAPNPQKDEATSVTGRQGP
jgi:hypothetical protein